jgi:gamma-glutamyltranspeptidase/glutathione hydrolase
MVSSTHWLASSAGMAALEAGGNAFDAAVTAGFVLQVVEPHLNGPGGEVPVLLYSSARDEVVVINGQGPFPARADADHFRGLGLDLVPGTGLLPACVPGAFDAWMVLLARYGTMRVEDVLRPAIAYAHGGFPVVPGITRTIAGVQELFRSEWLSSGEVYLAEGGPPQPGALFANRVLAGTYERIADEATRAASSREDQIDAARDLFYRGFVAHAVVEFARREVIDSSGERHSGLLEADDMATFEAEIEEPVTLDYRDYTVCKTGPWGQGPVFLQQLALLDTFDVAATGPGTPELIHTVVEVAKLAFADREAWYGDPRFFDVPLDALLDPEYARARRDQVAPAASHELRPGSVAGRVARLPARAAEASTSALAGVGEPTIGGDTCHVDVVDRDGNLVAATPSGGWLQSSPCIPGLGFPLGTRGQTFWLDEGLPNSLDGSKRPRTTLSPSLALRHSTPYMAFGTPGGDQQDQWTLTFFLNHVHFHMNLQEAIDAPTFHTEHFPSSFFPRRADPGRVVVEGRVPTDVVESLRARGHNVTVAEAWSLGRVCAVAREPDGILKAAADPRHMQGYAVGR